MNRTKCNEIIDLIDRHLYGLGYECLEVEWDASDLTLRVFIDGPNGIVMDDCLNVNRVLMEISALDSLIEGDYRLEVSSPGIERPLRTRDHFRKVIGEQIKIKLCNKADHRNQGIGKLVDVSENDILTLELPSGPWQFPLGLIQSANLVYDWNQH